MTVTAKEKYLVWKLSIEDDSCLSFFSSFIFMIESLRLYIFLFLNKRLSHIVRGNHNQKLEESAMKF